MVWQGERLTWIGRDADLPAELEEDEEHDAGGRLVVPGLIDAHTHLAFAGWRADEFERRLHGERYQDIAAGGGGILRTVAATRLATEDDLVARASQFVAGMAALGVTTVECKSGYGSDDRGRAQAAAGLPRARRVTAAEIRADAARRARRPARVPGRSRAVD